MMPLFPNSRRSLCETSHGERGQGNTLMTRDFHTSSTFFSTITYQVTRPKKMRESKRKRKTDDHMSIIPRRSKTSTHSNPSHLPNKTKKKRLTHPGRRRSRHNSRHIPLPPRHIKNPPPKQRRLLRRRRLPRRIRRNRVSIRRFRPRRRPILRNLRQHQTKSTSSETKVTTITRSRRQNPSKIIRCGDPHDSSESRGDRRLRGSRPY